MNKILIICAIILPLTLSANPWEEADKEAKKEKGKMKKELVLKKFDKDGDGQLNEAEKKEAKKAQKKFAKGKKEKKKQRKMNMLKKFDADGDGKLSEEEKAQARKHREEMKARFDFDGDGELSREEREQLKEFMKSQRDSK